LPVNGKGSAGKRRKKKKEKRRDPCARRNPKLGHAKKGAKRKKFRVIWLGR